MSQFQLSADREIAHRRRVFVEFSQILIQDINIFNRFFCRPKLLKSRLVSWSVVVQF